MMLKKNQYMYMIGVKKYICINIYVYDRGKKNLIQKLVEFLVYHYHKNWFRFQS